MGIIIWLPIGKRWILPPLVSIFQDNCYQFAAVKWHKGSGVLLGGRGWISNLLLAAVCKTQCLVDMLCSLLSCGEHCWTWKASFQGCQEKQAGITQGWQCYEYVVCCDILYDELNIQLGYVGSLICLLLFSPSSSASLWPLLFILPTTSSQNARSLMVSTLQSSFTFSASLLSSYATTIGRTLGERRRS